jgi:hypothetical protein
VRRGQALVQTHDIRYRADGPARSATGLRAVRAGRGTEKVRRSGTDNPDTIVAGVPEIDNEERVTRRIRNRDVCSERCELAEYVVNERKSAFEIRSAFRVGPFDVKSVVGASESAHVRGCRDRQIDAGSNAVGQKRDGIGRPGPLRSDEA